MANEPNLQVFGRWKGNRTAQRKPTRIRVKLANFTQAGTPSRDSKNSDSIPGLEEVDCNTLVALKDRRAGESPEIISHRKTKGIGRAVMEKLTLMTFLAKRIKVNKRHILVCHVL